MLLKASTARNRSFLLVQSADHLTGLTGATPTVTLSKDGGAFAAAGGTVTEIANGVYKIALTTTDTNTKGDLFYHVTAASADACDFADQVVTDLPGDTIATVTTVTTVTNQLTAAQIATGVWQDATAGDFTTASSIGKSLYTSGNAPGAASGIALVGSNMGSVSSVTGAVGSVTAGVTVTTNNDKTGYSLTVTPPTSAQVATAVWQDTTAGDFTTVGSIGKSLFTSGNAPGAASGLALVGSNMGTVTSVTGAVGSVTAAVLLSAGTGAGQLDFTSGVVKSNLSQILGTALTETAGQIAAAFKKFFNIATPASTMDHLTLIDTVTTATTATNLTNAPTAGDFTAAMKTSLNAATPASVTGAVGSVTAGVTLAAAAIDAASLATAGKQAIADGILDRDMSVGTDSGSPTVRTVRQSLRTLRNKVDIPGGTVYKEDDLTASWTFGTTTAAGNPVTVVDPA